MRQLPRSVVYALFAIGIAVLAGDFLFIYIPFSGWVLQTILAGVYFELLGTKKTVIFVAMMEIFFIASYGGAIATAFFISILGPQYLVPMIVLLYLSAFGIVLLLGFAANYLFRRLNLFKRIGKAYSHQ